MGNFFTAKLNNATFYCSVAACSSSPQLKNQKGSRRFATVREPYVLAAGRFAAHRNYQPLWDYMDGRAYGHRDVVATVTPLAADAAAGCNYSALSQGR